MQRRNKKTKLSEEKANLKSKLERYCHSQLVESGMSFCYECQVYELLPAFDLEIPCYEHFKKRLIKKEKVNNMSSTPDFIVNDKYIIETKGHLRPRDQVVWKLFKHHIKQKKLDYYIFMPRNKKQVDFVIDYIKHDTKRIIKGSDSNVSAYVPN